jgi:hypothetical protein
MKRKGSRERLTILRNVCNRCVEVRSTEDVADDARNRHRKVVNANATFSRWRRVQSRALEVRVRLLVQLRFVLDPSSDRLVGVKRTELEIRNVALEEVAEVVRDTKTCKRESQ